MKVQYDSDFLKKLKKLNVRIRKSFRKRLEIFLSNPLDLALNNHKLRDKYLGYRSIDITGDYRAIYEELDEGDEPIAYFFQIGTHQELYETQ